MTGSLWGKRHLDSGQVVSPCGQGRGLSCPPLCTGCRGDVGLLRRRLESLCSLARGLRDDSRLCAASAAGPESSDPQADPRELESLASSLLFSFEAGERPDLLRPWEVCHQKTRAGGAGPSEGPRPASGGSTGVPTRVSELHGAAPARRVQWV